MKLIEGSVKFVVYDENFFYWDCFICVKCGILLVGEKFCVVEGEKICIKCSF